MNDGTMGSHCKERSASSGGIRLSGTWHTSHRIEDWASAVKTKKSLVCSLHCLYEGLRCNLSSSSGRIISAGKAIECDSFPIRGPSGPLYGDEHHGAHWGRSRVRISFTTQTANGNARWLLVIVAIWLCLFFNAIPISDYAIDRVWPILEPWWT